MVKTHRPLIGLIWVLLAFLFLKADGLLAQCNTCNSDVSFTTNPEFAGPYAQTSQVDVDLGNSPATFVTEAYWQIYGSAPSAATVNTQVNNLLTLPYWRRIDVVNTFMTNAGRTIPRVYSEPWQSEPQFLTAPCKNVSRDVGAVCMFFFSCPGGTNCTMDWANTHVEGMNGPSTLLGYGANSSGYYTSASNAGFWERELLDARYAGLSYLLPNVYGPDLSDGSIANLASALGTVNSMGVTAQVKIGLFDDTSGWNNNPDFPFAPWNNSLWTSASTLDGYGTSQIDNAASIIYQDKWKAFFSQIPSQYWYELNGHPLVYMYYGGTIPVDGSSQPIIGAIVAQIKVLFQADFGVTPYVVIDIGFSYGEANVADNQFVWNTLASPYVTNYISTYTNNGVTADLAMVKWDPLGRDDGGSNAVATNYSGGYSSAGGVIKDDSYLKAALNNSLSANFLTIATWNDLGEGTGINRNYDYYVQGQWEPPSYFMNDIRHSQSQVTCVPGTSTNTPTLTYTSTPTGTFTQTPTLTPTMTSTNSVTPSLTYTLTATFTGTPSLTPTLTATTTFSVTVTHTPADTLTPMNSATGTSTASATLTETNTRSSTPSFTPSLTATYTFSPAGTLTFTNTASLTETKTPAPATPTFTITPTNTPTRTFTFIDTFTPTLTVTETFTATASSTETKTFTLTPTLTMTSTFTFTDTSIITSTPTSTWTVTRTGTASPTGTPTATPTPTGSNNALPVIYPNPATEGTVHIHILLPDPSTITVEIFTISFRKVREMVFPQQPAGVDMAVDLVDQSGITLANGLYYVSVSSSLSPARKITKLLILR